MIHRPKAILFSKDTKAPPTVSNLKVGVFFLKKEENGFSLRKTCCPFISKEDFNLPTLSSQTFAGDAKAMLWLWINTCQWHH